MPAKLKRFASQVASAGRKPFDPGRVRRQQQFLLYGGGLAVTLFILICAALVVRLDVQDYRSQGRSTFLFREAQFFGSMQAADMLLAAMGSRLEHSWNQGARPSPDALEQFSNGGGALTARDGAGSEMLLALAEITPDRPAASYAGYLGALLAMVRKDDRSGPTLPSALELGAEPFGGYLIGLDGRFLAVVGPGLVARARSREATTDLAALIARLMPTGAAKQKAFIQSRQVMLDRRFDPLSGREVVRFARRLEDAAGRPFGWLVVNGAYRVADAMMPRSDDEDVAVVDARGNIVFGRERDPAMIALALRDARDPLGEHVAVRRVGARFIVYDRLPGSSLVLMTTFSWRSVLTATLVSLNVTLGAALIGLALLWSTIVVFDRRALRPANRRAIRLIESEAFNRTLIRHAPAGLVLLSVADGETMVRNDAVLAYDRGVSGLPLGKRIWHAYREHQASNADRRGVMQQELAIEYQGHAPAYLAAHVVRTKFRGVDVLLCTLTDVTARRLTEDKLKEARTAAEDANKAKSTFLATMSHEIRTPLNAIVGNLELMERAPLPPDERRRLQTVMSSSDALLRVINDVLDLSKAESNQMVLEAVPFDLRAVLRDVAAIFEPLAEAKQLALECNLDPQLADGYVGDPTRVRQIVSNLISNAIKFTERGSVTLVARPAGTFGQAHRVEVVVRDTGIGIAPESLPALFDVYVQTDPSIYRRFGGTGLGLPLCRRLARLMQGDLTVESRVGHGAAFTASLPLPVAASGWRAVFDESDAGVSPVPSHAEDEAPLRVLVAEDHPASRALLRDQLEALRCDATLVANGVEAMRAYFTQPFDVVLTDLGMPELDGFAVANFLREQGAKVPVIAMTAHATDEDRRRCAQAGVVEVVLKPLSIDSLGAVLCRHGGQRGVVAEAAAPAVRAAVPVMTDEMRRTLREATLRSLVTIEAALSSDDAASLRRELHSMRGGFALAGVDVARDACAEMESVLKAGDVWAFKLRWPAFRHTITCALERIGE
ncbi:hybrid sensor histidine kinase/response regulator [Burkholderia ambifaria]|uniref:hybrid sensor histidine kinase/response regulator n=1 Tax=Burkholderia ambifaria TaxID=152480 RepID=UPI0015889244|nr:hybrid sensor histidine kinase/response regulator [Burkholderia ambifaria]WDR88020.1 ATP-binding protein [Burkholderia ambifaria]WDS00749.1 ATP-binding protein [Burkholderia ambifaria]